MNSPVIDNFGFHELNLDHLAEPENHFTLDLFVDQNGGELVPSVTDGQLSGTGSLGKVSGQALLGAGLLVTHGDTKYIIRIQSVGRVQTWAALPSGAHPALETYVLGWTFAEAPTKELTPLCPHPPSKDEALGLNAYDSVIFEGDRIKADSKLVSSSIEPSWFNIGCAGNTLAKMALTGHTQADTALGFTTSTEQRQTMLKMLSADYCGDGTPFTVAGQPLQWADDQGWMKTIPGSQLEARWTSNGAACLMKPRVVVHPTPLSNTTFGTPTDLEAAIAAHCPGHQRPPQCADEQLTFDGDHLISANPP
jgi:hypothetical protein